METLSDLLSFGADVLIFAASQLFWIRRVVDLGERFIPGKPRRAWLTAVVGVAYLFFFAYNLATWDSPHGASTELTLRSVLFEAPFWWWFVGSLAGFILVIVFWAVDRATRAAAWVYRKARGAAELLVAAPKPDSIALDPPSPARRHFLEQTAAAVTASPFVAAGYGLLYGRLDVEVTRRRIVLARLPKAFEGFRIAQLSDIHISPFMTAGEIRRCAVITNGLKADLVVLTGDFLTWDPGAQGEVVHALAGSRAPYGVFGCLGNHEIYTKTQDSITRLFAAAGIRILRLERASIQSQGESLNLIGVDFQGQHGPPLPPEAYLRGVQQLVLPETINILLSHNPNSFDRAAQLGIDLSLAGHTHGGQLALEFVHRGLNLSHPDYPYDRGWYKKGSAQIYVNRGIGTIGFPIRFGSPPEITVFELMRA
jgi:predicted MPP superfamily phosphohydrolase